MLSSPLLIDQFSSAYWSKFRHYAAFLTSRDKSSNTGIDRFLPLLMFKFGLLKPFVTNKLVQILQEKLTEFKSKDFNLPVV